ncbi:hypothetical protein HPB51_004782 [Rhipicephalus microplus]|uniref:Uncharacterized protein n=1 Tax=Rhipicephalus microplus TaxID=6941 RepID=A0A9J6E6Q3_RHIMP|nr:hypothetical protein HPB51_004782 [Rhipicephalus microplus]
MKKKKNAGCRDAAMKDCAAQVFRGHKTQQDCSARTGPQQENPDVPNASEHAGRAAALLGFLASKHPWHPYPALTCGLTAVVTFVVGAVYVAYLFGRRNRDTGEPRFCCPNEADLVVWYVNRSVVPCKDFFAYVCSNVIADGLQLQVEQSMYSWRALITGHIAADARRGDTWAIRDGVLQVVHGDRHTQISLPAFSRQCVD